MSNAVSLRFWKALAIAVACLTASFSAAASELSIEHVDASTVEGMDAFDVVDHFVSIRLRQGQYADVDQLIERWEALDKRQPDGRPKLHTLGWVLRKQVKSGRWNEGAETITAWKATSPDSRGAAIYEAMYWTAYGWDARGSGYAGTVTELGWKLFRERLETAERALIASKRYASQNPLWYEVYLSTAIGLGWPLEKYMRLVDEAIEKFPGYFPVYLLASERLRPEWGGSYDLFEEFVIRAVERTRTEEGTSLYARLYWSLDYGQKLEFDLFRDTRATWPKMKQGFEDLIARQPESDWILSSYASFACRASDGDAYLHARGRMNVLRPWRQAFQSNYSVDLCNTKFGYKEKSRSEWRPRQK